MKCFAAIVLLALFAVALAAEKPAEPEKVEPANAEAEAGPRDKRGLVLGTAYTAPLAYAPYVSPVAYTSSYSLPYAYSAYRSYPYYYNSYIYG